MTIDPNWILASIAGLGMLFSAGVAMISVGVFKSKLAEHDKRHDGHDRKFDEITHKLEAIAQISTSIEVLKSEQRAGNEASRHSMANIKQSIMFVERLVNRSGRYPGLAADGDDGDPAK